MSSGPLRFDGESGATPPSPGSADDGPEAADEYAAPPLSRFAGEEGADAGAAQRRLRWLLPLAVVAFGALAAWLLHATQERPQAREPEVSVPLVRVIRVMPQTVQLDVKVHGTVTPRTESDLVAEVRGRVLDVAANFVAGGVVRAGDPLLRLDDREHRLAVDRARAALALRQSEARLATADAARRRELAQRGAVSAAELELYESRAAVAAAARNEARAALAQARLELERTTLTAPFDGRVRERNVDVGQFVTPGQKAGRVYATDYSEVRLPIQTDALALLELPTGAAGLDALDIPVTLRATLAGVEHSWPARLVRSEGDIDPRTRMMHVVARIDDPYGRGAATSSAVVDGDAGVRGVRELPPALRVPLPAGLFVEAVIEGRRVDGAYELPLMALREDDRVFVASADDHLEVRRVEVLRRAEGRVVIRAGLSPGERVVVSPLRVYSPGMQLRAVDAS